MISQKQCEELLDTRINGNFAPFSEGVRKLTKLDLIWFIGYAVNERGHKLHKILDWLYTSLT